MKTTRALFAALKLIPLLLLGGCSALQVVNSVSKIYNVDVKGDLPIAQAPSLTYDLYLPNRANEALPNTPVVVFFYGGSWNRGDKSEYEFVGRRLASMGYITAVPNYRLYPQATYPGFLEDSAAAVASVLAELAKPDYAALKPDQQVVLMGHSAGGYNAAMVAKDSRWLQGQGLERKAAVRGFVGLAGAYNIYPIKVLEVQPVFLHPNYPEDSQPIDYAAQPQPPSLLLAPESDTLLSIERNSVALHNALLKAGNQSELVQVKGTDHITLIGTLSPLLFFKGSTATPIEQFISSLYSGQASL